jgi:hypothetical protein
MGSSGSSSFSDYSEQKPTSAGANNGGASQIDKCNLAFACSLEEVSRCSYFKEKGIPSLGTEVVITFNKVRLAAIDMSSGEEIGYLPTKFNYIKNCIDAGFSYSGVVRSISISPTPSILIDITPS